MPVTHARRFGLILPILFLAALPWPGHGKRPVDPDGLPEANPKHEWKILTGDPCVTTFAYAIPDIMPAACRQFERDKWQIYDQEDGGTIITCWKPMHHPLVRLFMGSIHARCTVTLKRLGPNKTLMTFEGALASHHDLHGNLMLGAAMREYRSGARHYAEEVRDYLRTHARYSSLDR